MISNVLILVQILNWGFQFGASVYIFNYSFLEVELEVGGFVNLRLGWFI